MIESKQKSFWVEAINTRRSVRSFERKALESETLQKLKDFSSELKAPFEHNIEIRFFKSTENSPIANNLAKPPEDCVSFIANTDLLSVAKVGFVGELFLVYANGLGVSTCWFGHYILSEVERLLSDVPKQQNAGKYGYGAVENVGRRAICISPIGYWKSDALRLVDRMTTQLMSFKRKPLDERLKNGTKEAALNKELCFALDLARKAPSAANTQHWEFTVSPDQKTVSIAKPIGYKHLKWEHPDVCVGGCAAHFWLGLLIQDIACTVTTDVQDKRVIWNFNIF